MDKVSKETRSRMMAAVKGKDTGPELMLRKALWRKGLRYRVGYGRKRIDIAFPARKLAIFIDGCFWHMCPIHGTMPASNISYWKPKLETNRERDLKMTHELQAEGWTVLRLWEHELKDMDAAIAKIVQALEVSYPNGEPAGRI